MKSILNLTMALYAWPLVTGLICAELQRSALIAALSNMQEALQSPQMTLPGPYVTNVIPIRNYTKDRSPNGGCKTF